MRSLTFLKNFFIGSLGLLLKVILNFTVRTVFIYTLSEAYLGINGLLTSVLTVLNLANLGMDAAIVYAMYKPVAEKDDTVIFPDLPKDLIHHSAVFVFHFLLPFP